MPPLLLALLCLTLASLAAANPQATRTPSHLLPDLAWVQDQTGETALAIQTLDILAARYRDRKADRLEMLAVIHQLERYGKLASPDVADVIYKVLKGLPKKADLRTTRK